MTELRSSIVNHGRVQVHLGATEDNPGRTKQEFRDDCDINVTVARFLKTGQMPDARPAQQFGDFSTVTNFHDATQQVREAENEFATLPSAMRSRFNNNPGELLDFLDDPDNLEEAIELGIIPAQLDDQVEPTATPPVTDPVTTPPEGGENPAPVAGGE